MIPVVTAGMVFTEIEKEYNIEKLELELSDKKDTIEKLNKDIIALKIIKEIHMTTCEKKIERLKEKLNQVKKEQFFKFFDISLYILTK